MEIYKEKHKKSWAIKLISHDGEPSVCAVNSITGKEICKLIRFNNSGRIVSIITSRDIFVKEGYDPNEHGNTFKDNGQIIMSM